MRGYVAMLIVGMCIGALIGAAFEVSHPAHPCVAVTR